MSEYLPAHQHHAGCGCYQPPGPTVYQPVPLDQPPPPTGGPCVHPYPYPHVVPQQYPGPPQGGAGPVVAKWIGIGIGSGFLALSLALSAVAVAISAVALTTCVLILRSVWSQTKKGQ